jgi:hypothetical protein
MICIVAVEFYCDDVRLRGWEVTEIAGDHGRMGGDGNS